MNFSATLSLTDRGSACFLFCRGRIVLRRDGFTPSLAVAAMVLAVEASTLVQKEAQNEAKSALLTLCLMRGIDPIRVVGIASRSQNEGARDGLCRVV